MHRIVHARRIFAFLALAVSLSTVPLLGQRPVGELVNDINGALAEHPTDQGRYELRILPGGALAAQQSDAGGLVQSWEIYFEDIASVEQTRRGHLFLVCDEDLGECAKETCFGEFANFVGCTRAGDEADGGRRLSDVLVIEYAYDTRAYRRLQTAFDELLQHDLETVSAHGRSSQR